MPHHRQARRIFTAAVVSLIVVGCTVGVLLPAGLGWDFANFYDAGHRVAAGQIEDLYQQDRPIAGREPQGHMRFWGAPLSAAFYAPLSQLQPTTALVIFKLENTLALFLALAILYRHCRWLAGPTDRENLAPLFAGLCLLFQPFWTIYRVGGQTTPTVFLLLVVALLCHLKARYWVAALLLVVVGLIKPTFAILIAFLVCVSGSTFAIALAFALVFGGLVSIGLYGWPIHQEFLKVLVEGSRMSRPWLYNSSLYVPFENVRLLASPGLWSVRALVGLEWMLRFIVGGIFVVILRRSRREAWSPAARRHFEFLMAICFWLLTSQLIWEHYLTAMFLPLACWVAARSVLPIRVRVLIAAIFVMALGQNFILVQYVSTHLQTESVTALLVLGVLKAGPLILLLVMLTWSHRDIFVIYRSSAWRT